jgi:hypothetical protein
MLRTFAHAVLGLVLVAGVGLAGQDKDKATPPDKSKATKSKAPKPVTGKVKSIDLTKGSLKVTVGTEEKTFKVSKKTKGIKIAKEGAKIQVTTDAKGEVKSIKAAKTSTKPKKDKTEKKPESKTDDKK